MLRAPYGRSPACRTISRALLALVVMGVWCSADRATAQGTSVSAEYHKKATYIVNFTSFVAWPSEAMEDTSKPFIIGIFGDNPFGGMLTGLTAHARVKGKRVVVRPFPNTTDLDELTACHLLFINRAERARVTGIMGKLWRSPILTVSDFEGFAGRHGGIVNFVERQGRIRFEANITAARRAGLKIDSRLLRMAIVIR